MKLFIVSAARSLTCRDDLDFDLRSHPHFKKQSFHPLGTISKSKAVWATNENSRVATFMHNENVTYQVKYPQTMTALVTFQCNFTWIVPAVSIPEQSESFASAGPQL